MKIESSQAWERHRKIGVSVVIGGQYGDEGKGKITDNLAQISDVIIRFNGGHNAGHSVKIGNKEYALHMLPSGILSKGKENLILSSCVLGIDLYKISPKSFINQPNSKFLHNDYIYFNGELEDIYLTNDNDSYKRVGLIPELEAIEKGGIEIEKGALKISYEVPVIGMHDVLLDALDEQYRILNGNRAIGSTGSGISRAYTSKSLRYTTSLYNLIHDNGKHYFNAIKDIWRPYQRNFPNITIEKLIEHAKYQRNKIIDLVNKGKIEFIEDEKVYIRNLKNTGKKIIFEGAQSVMISDTNSYYGTASTPNLQTVLQVSGLTPKDIGNIFVIFKYPNSSVGTRPQFMCLDKTKYLDDFRKKYGEYGVTSGKPRDLWHLSLPHIARGIQIGTKGIDDNNKIVPVINRIDAFADSLKLFKNNIVNIILGFKYKYYNSVKHKEITKTVGIYDKYININNLLFNFPNKSQELNLFDNVIDINYLKIEGKNMNEQIIILLGYYVASIFKDNNEKEVIIGNGPERNDLEIVNIVPIRK